MTASRGKVAAAAVATNYEKSRIDDVKGKNQSPASTTGMQRKQKGAAVRSTTDPSNNSKSTKKKTKHGDELDSAIFSENSIPTGMRREFSIVAIDCEWRPEGSYMGRAKAKAIAEGRETMINGSSHDATVTTIVNINSGTSSSGTSRIEHTGQERERRRFAITDMTKAATGSGADCTSPLSKLAATSTSSSTSITSSWTHPTSKYGRKRRFLLKILNDVKRFVANRVFGDKLDKQQRRDDDSVEVEKEVEVDRGSVGAGLWQYNSSSTSSTDSTNTVRDNNDGREGGVNSSKSNSDKSPLKQKGKGISNPVLLFQMATRTSVFIIDMQSLCRQPPAGQGYEVR
jgi:hypothetical protein